MSASDVRHDEIMQVEKKWSQAALASSAEAYEELLVDDFCFIMHGGELLLRSEFLRSVRNGERRIAAMVYESVQVRFYETTAIVTGTLFIDAEFQGKPFRGPSRVTKVWVLRESRWMLASFHASDARLVDQWGKLRADSVPSQTP